MTAPGWDRLFAHPKWPDAAADYLELKDQFDSESNEVIRFRMRSRMRFFVVEAHRFEREIFDGLTFDEWRESERKKLS